MINPIDIEIIHDKPKNPGGQQVGLVSAQIRLRHIPTGIEVYCNCMRSQMRNRKVCMAMLEEALTNPEFNLS